MNIKIEGRSATCTWVMIHPQNEMAWATECKTQHIGDMSRLPFNYCPHCGGKLFIDIFGSVPKTATNAPPWREQ